MDHLKLTVDKLSVDAVSELVIDDSCGAVSIFVGTTRDNFEGKKVVRLDYEAYEPMAIKSMKSICDDIRKKWSQVHGIAIYHRLGEVPAREASVIIAISSPHRADSLAAVSHCIDSLKASVPIWKKEVYDGAAPAWKENAECPTIKEERDRESERGLVQITASDEELMQRIQNFIDRKREQVNLSNVVDFTGGGRDAVEAEERDGCARVLAVFHKRKGNDKGHLKMSRVHNEWGPQVKRARPAPSVSAAAGPGPLPLPAAVAERVLGAERYVGLAPVAGDVYRRLKAIEDRIATLEGVSPEYAMFWRVPEMESARVKQELHEECLYTADDIAKKIEMLEGEG